MRCQEALAIAALSLLGALLLMALSAGAAAAADHYVDWDWNVTEDTKLVDDTWYVSGNLTVTNCTLTLERAWLRMYTDFWHRENRLIVGRNASLVAITSRVTLSSYSSIVTAGDVRFVGTTLDGLGDWNTYQSINQTGGSLVLDRCTLDLSLGIHSYASLVIRDCRVTPRAGVLNWMPEGYCARAQDGRRHTALIERTRFGDGLSTCRSSISLGGPHEAPSDNIAWGDWAIVVRNCTFISCDYPIYVSGNIPDYSALVENNTAYDTTYYGVAIHSGARILLRNNHWQMAIGNSAGLGLFNLLPGWEPVIENDTVEGGDYGVNIQGARPYGRPTVVLTGLTVTSCDTGVVVFDAEVDLVGGQVHGVEEDFHLARGGAVHLLGCAYGPNHTVDYNAVELAELWPMHPSSVTWDGIWPITEGTVRFDPEGACSRSMLNCSDPREVWLTRWSRDFYATHVRSNLTPVIDVDGLSFLGDAFDLVHGGSFDVVIHDNITPELDLASPAEGDVLTSASVLVSGNCTELGSGLDWVGVSLDGGPWLVVTGWYGAAWCMTLEGVPDGAHALAARAVDRAGRAAQTPPVGFVVDVVPPTIEPLGAPWPLRVRFSPVTVRLLTEAGSKAYVDGREVPVGDLGEVALTLTVTAGPNTFHLRVVDKGGWVAEADITVFLDMTPPQILLNSPVEDEWTSEGTVVVDGYTEPDATVLVDDMPTEVVDGHFIRALALPEGAHLVTVKAYDTVGNLAVLGVDVNVDRTPPVVSIESPADGLVTREQSIQVSGLVDELWLDRIESPSGNVSVAVNIWSLRTALSEGPNTICVVARDRAGNVGNASVTVVRDTVGPTYAALLLLDGAELRPGEAERATGSHCATLLVTAYERCSVHLDGVEVAELGTEGWRWEVLLQPGHNRVVVHCEDAIGNAGRECAFLVWLDARPPPLTVLEPTDKARVASGAVTVRGLTEPGARVTVNGVEAEVGPSGAFSVDVGLAFGLNELVVVATDACGNDAGATLVVTRVRTSDGGAMGGGALTATAAVAAAGLVGVLALLLLLRRSARRSGEGERSQGGPAQGSADEGADGGRLGSHVRRRGR